MYIKSIFRLNLFRYFMIFCSSLLVVENCFCRTIFLVSISLCLSVAKDKQTFLLVFETINVMSQVNNKPYPYDLFSPNTRIRCLVCICSDWLVTKIVLLSATKDRETVHGNVHYFKCALYLPVDVGGWWLVREYVHMCRVCVYLGIQIKFVCKFQLISVFTAQF